MSYKVPTLEVDGLDADTAKWLEEFQHRITNDPALLKKYSDYAVQAFRDLVNELAEIGMANGGVFNYVWNETFQGEKPLDQDVSAKAAHCVLNMQAVARAINRIRKEGLGEAMTFSKASIDEMFASLEKRDPSEKGN